MVSPDTAVPNYPDILGYITGGERLTLNNVVEAALAVHPRAERAGRPFEVIALMQNITDVNIQVTAVLQLPEKDAKNVSGRFFAKNDRLSITLHPAETGYLALPASSYPDTAPGEYRIGLEIDLHPLDKPRRIRQKPESNTEVNLSYYFSLSEESLTQLATLKSLSFSSARRGMFGGKTLEAPFQLAPSKGAKLLRSSPEWISLWSLGADTDARPLLERHHRLLEEKILPQFKPLRLYEPLYNSTRDRMMIAKYPIQPAEVHYITKLMVAVLELGSQPHRAETFPGENLYRVAGLIQKGWPTDGRPIPLPYWCRRLLYTIGFDNRVIENPVEALARPLYEELMRDTIRYGFKLLEHDMEVALGNDDDIRAYSDQIIRALWEPELTLDFLDVHMPMVLGGLLVDERVKMASEDRFNNFHTLLDMYEKRQAEYGEDMGIFFELALYIVDSLLQKHGFWTG